MTVRVIEKVLLGIVLVSAFGLSITKVEDSDAWTHLALGREMVEHRGSPGTEPFTYPSAGTPYYNPEWLFDVVLYLAYWSAAYAGVIALKAFLISLVFLILWKDSALTRDPPHDRTLDLAIRTAVLLTFLVMVRYRIVERPDLVLMVFLGFTIYALNAYLVRGRRYVYLLPVLQVLWVNMHPSIVAGIVPFVAVLAGGPALRLIHRWRGVEPSGTPTMTQLRTVAIVFVAVLLASLVNPYGVQALTQPFHLAQASWHIQHIIELQPPRVGTHPGLFVLTALLALTFLPLARRLPVMSLLLVAPFVYLGLSALRFIVLLLIVAAPILARNLSVIAGTLSRSWARRGSLAFAVGASGLALIAISLAVATKVEPFANPRQIPGIGVNDLFVPEGALRYLDRIGMNGRVFNKFHWGGYIAWRDFPRRVPIIDGRGHVPPRVLDEIHFAATNPVLLDRLQAQYGFDVALMAYPPVTGYLVDTETTSAQWALVYWDDVALVYLRRSTRFAAIIDRDEYRFVKPAYGTQYLRRTLADQTRRSAITAESRRNVTETGSSIGYTFLGFGYLQAGEYDRAIEAFDRVAGYSTVWDAYQGLALAYWQKGNLDRAISYYKHVLSFVEDPILLYNLGLALSQVGNTRDAVHYLERARAANARFTPLYPLLIDAYRRLGETRGEQQVAAAYAHALKLGQADEHLASAVRLDRQGRSTEAAGEVKASLTLNPGSPAAHSLLGDVYVRQGLLEDAVSQYQAALRLDGNYATAYYALGRLYQKRGQLAAARAHFEEYVRREPGSYRSWTVREELSRLPRS